jgi:predicted TPR repeat methyltransferase
MTDTGPLFVSSGDLVSDRRYKAAVELAGRGDFAAAADVLTQTVEAAPGFATAWFALGAIRDRLGDRDGAVAAFHAASRADPDDYHGARLQLARLGAGTGTPAMTEPYVRRLFDQYAGRYDTALTEHLHYRGPALLLAAVKSALERLGQPMHFESLLDLGCGTGLAGAVFRPFAARLVGVDLSAAMIARAEAKGDYDRLVVGNLAASLSDEIAKAAQYDLVLAADVFGLRQRPCSGARRYRPRAGAARRGRIHGGDTFRRRRHAIADAALRLWRALSARCHGRRRLGAAGARTSGDPHREGSAGGRPCGRRNFGAHISIVTPTEPAEFCSTAARRPG